MPAAAATAVYSFAIWVGGSAGTAAVAGAVAGAVVKGAIIGAVIGGATAAATGQDIFQGALKGAAIAGITAGVFSIGSMAAASVTGGSAAGGIGTSAAGQLGNLGVAAYAPAGVTSAGAAVPAGLGEVMPTAGELVSAGAPGVPSAAPIAAGQEVVKKGILSSMSPEAAQIAAGVGQGLATGVGNVGAAIVQEDAAEKQAQRVKDEEREKRERNASGDWQKIKLDFNPPDSWKKYLTYLEPRRTQAGLLSKGATT